MTPLQLAKTECANYEPDGRCLGVDIAPDLKTVPLWQKHPARCVLADGQSCRYFETAVLAGIPMIHDERKETEWLEAADEYERKYDHERGLGKGSVERTGNDGIAGMLEKAVAQTHLGRGTTSSQIANRLIRLSGRGRAKVACGTEIGAR